MRWRQILQFLGTFAGLFPGPVLVKASFGAQLSPSHMHPGPAEAAINCRSLVAPNRLVKASHRQRITLACTRVPSKRSRTNTQRPASVDIRAGSNKLNRQHIQKKILAGTKPCGGEFCFGWQTIAQQRTCRGRG